MCSEHCILLYRSHTTCSSILVSVFNIPCFTVPVHFCRFRSKTEIFHDLYCSRELIREPIYIHVVHTDTTVLYLGHVLDDNSIVIPVLPLQNPHPLFTNILIFQQLHISTYMYMHTYSIKCKIQSKGRYVIQR